MPVEAPVMRAVEGDAMIMISVKEQAAARPALQGKGDADPCRHYS